MLLLLALDIGFKMRKLTSLLLLLILVSCGKTDINILDDLGQADLDHLRAIQSKECLKSLTSSINKTIEQATSAFNIMTNSFVSADNSDFTFVYKVKEKQDTNAEDISFLYILQADASGFAYVEVDENKKVLRHGTYTKTQHVDDIDNLFESYCKYKDGSINISNTTMSFKTKKIIKGKNSNRTDKSQFTVVYTSPLLFSKNAKRIESVLIETDSAGANQTTTTVDTTSTEKSVGSMRDHADLLPALCTYISPTSCTSYEQARDVIFP
jgi:hypothetical protein